jgi:uncharacterized protein YdaU (DUF1376 family)
MNWYPRYYGDYMKQTAHLSLAEHGAYTVLLDHYYGTEKPLAGDLSAAGRICRAFDETEKAAVESICNQFFPVCADGMRHNKRADEEIAKANAISSERSSAGLHGAKKRWEKQKHGNCHELAKAKEQHLALPPPPPPQEQPKAQPELLLVPGDAVKEEKKTPKIKKQRERNPRIDTLAGVEGDVAQTTTQSFGRIAKALAEIMEVCPLVTPDEIKRRAENYKTHFPECVVTANALSKHWAKCENPVAAKKKEEDNI